jgi:hypothetical protein
MLIRSILALLFIVVIPQISVADCNPFTGCDNNGDSARTPDPNDGDDGPSPYGACDSAQADCVQRAGDAYNACSNHCTTDACNDRCEARVEDRSNFCESARQSCYEAAGNEIESRHQLEPPGTIHQFGQPNNGWQQFNCLANGGTNC